MTVEDSCNLEVAQATNILAIIDFTGEYSDKCVLLLGTYAFISRPNQLRVAQDWDGDPDSPGSPTHEGAQ